MVKSREIAIRNKRKRALSQARMRRKLWPTAERTALAANSSWLVNGRYHEADATASALAHCCSSDDRSRRNLSEWGVGTAIEPWTGRFIAECMLWLAAVALIASPLTGKGFRARLIAAIPR
jgi:hypothetical protein